MRLVLILLSLLLAARSAHGHGQPINLLADSSGQLHPSQSVFAGSESVFQTFDATQQRFVAAFTVPTADSGIAHGTVLSFDITGDPTAVGPSYSGQALLYWDGSQIVPTSQIMTITRSSATMLLDQDDTFVTGSVVGAYDATTPGWHGSVNLFLPLTAPTGVYAVGLRVTSPDYQTSETLWIAGNVGLSDADFARGVAAITHAVPEPSSLMLLSVGCLATVVQAVRRR